MDLQDVFISNLKRFRKEQHITQEKLAELCDTETSYIGQIETKKRLPISRQPFKNVILLLQKLFNQRMIFLQRFHSTFAAITILNSFNSLYSRNSPGERCDVAYLVF